MIKEYLAQKALVQAVSTVKELETKVEDSIRSSKPLHLMMGQTFDSGQPVEMLKYALFMMDLADQIRAAGAQVTSNWLIADHFMVEINQDQAAAEAKVQRDKRVAYLSRLNQVYHGDIGFVFSSELSRQDDYQRNLAVLSAEAEINPEFRKLVSNAIPKDRREQQNAFRYPLEELATIQTMDTDVKIGPPYEALYDKPAREFAPVVGFNKYVAVQLTRSFPFGNPKMPTEISDEIEQFGILPYKKGSKKLGNYRIDPINDDLGAVETLIRTTKDIRPIIDLLIIGDLARQRLGESKGQTQFVQNGLDLYQPARPFEFGDPEIAQGLHNSLFQDLAVGMYKEYVHKPLRE